MYEFAIKYPVVFLRIIGNKYNVAIGENNSE